MPRYVHGYCDMFLLPNLRYPETAHSYIIELKYLSVKDYDSQADKQWNEAVEQIHEHTISFERSDSSIRII